MENGDASRTNHDLRRTSTHGRDQRGAPGQRAPWGASSYPRPYLL